MPRALSLINCSLWRLTDTEGGASRPAMILFTDSHWYPDETKSWITLVHHAASVVIVLPDDLTIHDGLRSATMASYGRVSERVRLVDLFNDTKSLFPRKTATHKFSGLSCVFWLLTKTLDLWSTPKSIGHAFSDPRAHQGISCVAGENGCGSVHSQRSNLVPVWRSPKVATGDNWDEETILHIITSNCQNAIATTQTKLLTLICFL